MTRKRTLQEIDQEIAKLQQEASEIRASEKAEVVAKIKDAVAYYGITASEIGLSRGGRKARGAGDKTSARAVKGAKASGSRVKYKDNAGNAWSGVGRRPKWFLEALASGRAESDLRA